jgi:hypothetical protein
MYYDNTYKLKSFKVLHWHIRCKYHDSLKSNNNIKED